ncbi:hypothetical protein TQ38_025800 (plasmid) [Novosphingobium sp. P6W]|nr:hypothetical protein TQ38_025800 [Novosphingobium sp. P6W]KIS30355.1 hypothetical protein TQ38_22915 [Novosphingobium sp. P6W]
MREPDSDEAHSRAMTKYPQKRRLALVLAESTVQRHWQERELAREGYEVRCFQKAWDALAMFGTEMPDIGVIGQAQDTECLELLIEDLERYGVPVTAVEPFRDAMPPDRAVLFSRTRGHAPQWHHV